MPDIFTPQATELNALPVNTPPLAPHDIVFVDARVADSAALLTQGSPNAQVVFLQADSDGLQQIADYLGTHTASSVQILAHGAQGQLWLGRTFLDSHSLAGQGDALAAMGRALVPGGDILVYACNLGAGADGARFVSSLAALTGADVAASNNRTGAGGDWVLEISSGAIEATAALSPTAMRGYDHALATLTVTTGADSGAGSLRQAIADAAAGDTITFSAGMTVTLSSGQLGIDKNITIDGDLNNDGVADVTLDANHSSRVLSINSGTVTLDGLTITNGLAVGNGGDNTGNLEGPGRPGSSGLGGGIYNAATLIISHSTITDNKASGGGGTGGGYPRGGGGGGGGGYGSGFGGTGGHDRIGEAPTPPSAGHGGNGSGTSGGQRGGFGGSTTGGAGGGAGVLFVGQAYTVGGAGATANNGTISIGGGGGGCGGIYIGGAGGDAAGGIYNTGNLTVIGSVISNNIAAGGGGGGGAASSYPSHGNGGAGGNGVGGLWNNGGTVRIDAATNTSLASGNWGVGGSGGTANGTGNIAGVAGSSANQVLGAYSNNFKNPSLTSATYDASTGVLTVTGVNLTAGDIIAVSKLTVTGQGGASYTLTSGNTTATDATTFSLTLNAADQLALGGLLNQNGTAAVSGTAFNLAGAAGWDATEDAFADLSGNGVTVANVSAPSITSASYNASTHVLSVTGTHLVGVPGAANDITVSKLTLKGEGGAACTLTSSNMDVTDATHFAVTLNGTDQEQVETFFNKSGSSSTGGTTYNLAAADDWNSVVTGGDIAVTTAAVSVSHVAVPSITSTTYDAATGALVVTGTGFLEQAGAANDIDPSKLTFTGEGGATYTLTTPSVDITNGTSFTVTLAAADYWAINQIFNKNGDSSTGATTYNLAAAEDWAAGADATVIVADLVGNGITVSNVAVPTIASSTFDAATGTLAVTGAGFLKLNGATNDIDVSRLTFTGESGATYTLTTTSVEITNGTTFSVTLNSTDQAAINQIVNKNGTSSTGATTYNLAAAEDWAAGADAAVNVADLVGNGIAVSNVAVPTIASSTYDAATGALVVTGTGFSSRSGVGNDMVANKFTFSGEGGGTYSLTDTTNVEITSASSFTLVLSAVDKAGLRAVLNLDSGSSRDSTAYNLAAAEDWANGADAALTIADLTGNGVIVSNVAVPTLTSATYSASTGVLAVTGTHMLTGDTISVSQLTLTGQGGASYTLTTSSVTASSATAFSVSLDAADQIAVNGLLNHNGIAAVDTTLFNLAAASGWDGAASAGADLTGNTVTVSNVTAPTVTSAAYDVSTHVLSVTGTGLVGTPGAANDITTSKLTLTGESAATYTLTSSDVEVTNASSFAVTLNGADQAQVKAFFNKNGSSSTGGTPYNLAAADDWNSVVGNTDITVASTGVTVSHVPVPSITASTYDAGTGVLVVTGTDLPSLAGPANDIATNKFSIVGEGGATYTLTTSNVDVTSASAFSLTLSAQDRAAINLILNSAGTASTSADTYNLMAAEDWAMGADAAVLVADLDGNGITVSNLAAPTITDATYNAATGTLNVSGTGLLTLRGVNNDIVANMLSFTGQGRASYTLTDTPNVDILSGTSFSMTLSATDNTALTLLLSKNGASSIDGTTYNIAGSEGWAAGANGAVTIADLSGNGIEVSESAALLTGANYNASTGVLSVAGANLGTGDTIDVSKLTLTGEDGATYTLTTSNTTAASPTGFVVTLNATDKLSVNGLLNQNGNTAVSATPYNLAGSAGWEATSNAPADLAANAITVSDVTAPTITSATYDAYSHVLSVTGTNLVRTVGASNDITVAYLTITGESGATRALTTTSNVEITNDTSFSVTISGADLNAVTGLLNANGSSSSGAAVYNLAAADDWDSVIGASNTANATNALTVSGVIPPAQDPDPTPAPIDVDTDGISTVEEDAASGLAPAFAAGDGNGDGVQDSVQTSVASARFLQSSFAQSHPGSAGNSYVTLVADSLSGKLDTTDATNAQVTSLMQKDAPSNLPDGMNMPLGLFSLSAHVSGGRGTPATETFSLYMDSGLAINGYWCQDSNGTWVNLTSVPQGGQVVVEDNKIRLDFQITDGGEFDADHSVNGVISSSGAVGSMPLGLVGYAPDLSHGGFWF